MAKGWESKSVEAQMEAAQEVIRPHKSSFSPAQVDLLRKRETLMLSRTRVLREMESSVNPRYQEMLQRALVDLDRQIAALDKPKAAAARA